MPLYTTTFPTLTSAGALSVGGNAAVTGSLTVAGNALGETLPANHSAVAWAFDPAVNYNTQLLTNGTVYLTGLFIPRAVSVTKIYWWITSVAVTPTAGQSEVGLYSSAGTKLASANVDADLTSTGLKTTTISSQSLTAGSFVWVGAVYNAATAPTVARGPSVTGIGTVGNLGLTAATYRFATNGTAQTSLPSSITPASNSAAAFAGPWAAIGV
jgi:hypothetical protein